MPRQTEIERIINKYYKGEGAVIKHNKKYMLEALHKEIKKAEIKARIEELNWAGKYVKTLRIDKRIAQLQQELEGLNEK